MVMELLVESNSVVASNAQIVTFNSNWKSKVLVSLLKIILEQSDPSKSGQSKPGPSITNVTAVERA